MVRSRPVTSLHPLLYLALVVGVWFAFHPVRKWLWTDWEPFERRHRERRKDRAEREAMEERVRHHRETGEWLP